MHRTQLCFDEIVFEQVKQRSRVLGVSVSAYIRDVVQQDLDRGPPQAKALNLAEFFGMWEGRDVSQQALREQAWK